MSPDAVGDSLYLAQKGAESDAEILLEASVLFMNQILAIMKSRTSVCLPDLRARSVPLAAHADVDKDPPLEAGASRRYRDQLREHVFRREGGERLLPRIGQCRSGHSPRAETLGDEPADPFSARMFI